ncbi:hypothetical protein XENOCAPTIV_000611, partial [Xenoophorus captivus]
GDYRTSPPGFRDQRDSFKKGVHKDKSKSTHSKNNKLRMFKQNSFIVSITFFPTEMDEVNNELLMKITSKKTPAPRKIRIERSTGPHVPLNSDSDPQQVTVWLNAKGFSKP